jgi:hypothetical protein
MQCMHIPTVPEVSACNAGMKQSEGSDRCDRSGYTHEKSRIPDIFFVAAAAEATRFHVSVMNVWPRACAHSWMGGGDMGLCG